MVTVPKRRPIRVPSAVRFSMLHHGSSHPSRVQIHSVCCSLRLLPHRVTDVTLRLRITCSLGGTAVPTGPDGV